MLWLSVRVLLPLSIYKKSQTFHDSFILSLREQGVELETEKGTQVWSWQQFSAFKETLYFFHLYFDARSFFMVQKDAFADITQLQEARELLKQKIN